MQRKEGIEGIASPDFLVCWEREFAGDGPGVGVRGWAGGVKAEICGGEGSEEGEAEPIPLSLSSCTTGLPEPTPVAAGLPQNSGPMERLIPPCDLSRTEVASLSPPLWPRSPAKPHPLEWLSPSRWPPAFPPPSPGVILTLFPGANPPKSPPAPRPRRDYPAPAVSLHQHSRGAGEGSRRECRVGKTPTRVPWDGQKRGKRGWDGANGYLVGFTVEKLPGMAKLGAKSESFRKENKYSCSFSWFLVQFPLLPF